MCAFGSGDLPVITVTTLPYGGVWHLGSGGLRWVAAPDPPRSGALGAWMSSRSFSPGDGTARNMVFINTNGSRNSEVSTVDDVVDRDCRHQEHH